MSPLSIKLPSMPTNGSTRANATTVLRAIDYFQEVRDSLSPVKDSISKKPVLSRAWGDAASQAELLDCAIYAMKLQVSAASRLPLPLESIRERDGEPVWVEVDPTCGDVRSSGWHLVVCAREGSAQNGLRLCMIRKSHMQVICEDEIGSICRVFSSAPDREHTDDSNK